jgi:hypothetical protein
MAPTLNRSRIDGLLGTDTLAGFSSLVVGYRTASSCSVRRDGPRCMPASTELGHVNLESIDPGERILLGQG